MKHVFIKILYSGIKNNELVLHLEIKGHYKLAAKELGLRLHQRLQTEVPITREEPLLH
jgi:hypothetical protein